MELTFEASEEEAADGETVKVAATGSDHENGAPGDSVRLVCMYVCKYLDGGTHTKDETTVPIGSRWAI